MEHENGLEVIHDEPILGAAEFVERYERDGDSAHEAANADSLVGYLDTENDSNEALIGAMQEYASELDVAVAGSRGGFDEFSRLLDRLRGRTLVDDLGEYEFEIDWLTFHVPPRGTGQLKLSKTTGSKFGAKLSILGLGHGSGRQITLAGSKDFHERDHCLQLAQKVRAHVLVYADAGSDQPTHLQVDVVEDLASIAKSLEECPECSSGHEGDEVMYQQSAPAIDLRNDRVGQTQELTYTFENDSETEIGLPVALSGIELTPSVAVSRSLRLQSEVRYEFPGGYCFTPYTEIGEWVDFPFWRRT